MRFADWEPEGRTDMYGRLMGEAQTGRGSADRRPPMDPVGGHMEFERK